MTMTEGGNNVPAYICELVWQNEHSREVSNDVNPDVDVKWPGLQGYEIALY